MVHLTTLLPLVATLAGFANAHTTVWSLWVNGVDQGDGRNQYIRSPPNNDPVKDVASADIICNKNNRAVAKSVPVKGGDKITFEWYHDNRGDDIIAASHKGPVVVYIAPATGNGAGKVWTKLAEEGYSNGKWAVDNLIANKGKHSLTLPAGLAAGDYLLRAEIIAHHESETNYQTNPARGTQFYPSCAQIKVSGSGTVKPPGGYGFRTADGGYTPTDPGILFNLYGSFTSYPIPGPKVWTGGNSGGVVTPDPEPVEEPETTTTAPPTTTAAPTPTAKPVEPAPVKPTTTSSPPPAYTPKPLPEPPVQSPTQPEPPTQNPTQPKDKNACFNEVNKCYAAAQPKGGMGSPDVFQTFAAAWQKCQALWKTCEGL